MTAIILHKSPKKDKNAGNLPRQASYAPMPAEAAALVKEGWEDLDQAVDEIRDGIVYGFIALLEVPLQLMEGSRKARD